MGSMPYGTAEPQEGVQKGMATLTIPSTRSMRDPKVVLTVDPIARTVDAEVTETCPSCNGYGPPCGECRGVGQIRHECKTPADLSRILGREATWATLDTIRAFADGGG